MEASRCIYTVALSALNPRFCTEQIIEKVSKNASVCSVVKVKASATSKIVYRVIFDAVYVRGVDIRKACK